MAYPPIAALPTPPSRSQSPSTFSADADAFLGALPDFGDEANDLAGYLDTLAGEVDADAIAAAASATSAANSALSAAYAANYEGAYNAGTTYQIGDSVLYNDELWLALTVNTGVTPVEGANWRNLSVPSTFALITSVTASGASAVDFTNLSSDYSEYIILGRSLAGSTFINLRLRASVNNGVAFDSTTNYWDQFITADSSSVSATSQLNSFLRIGSLNSTDNSFKLSLRNIGVTRRLFIEGSVGRIQFLEHFSGARNLTTAVNAIRIYPDTGTISGTFYLYGVKAS
jgi:hypothetical protein